MMIIKKLLNVSSIKSTWLKKTEVFDPKPNNLKSFEAFWDDLNNLWTFLYNYRTLWLDTHSNEVRCLC